MKKALIIDGNNLLFKAYYATAYQGVNLHSLQGIPTNAVYAFIRMLTKYLKSNNYASVFVAFDAGRKTFRHETLATYKGKRSETPVELIEQFNLVKIFLDLAQIPWGQINNYEADDIIGSIVKNKIASNYQIDIMSSDKDLLQLLDNNIKILNPQKGMSDLKVITISTFQSEYELLPYQVTDLKGLMGDSSDNLPGIKGIGQKTAISLLKEYDTLENIIENVEQLKPNVSKLIKLNFNNGIICKQLAQLNLNTPITGNLETFNYNVENLNNEKLQDFYKQYNMNSLLTQDTNPKTNKNSTSHVQIINKWSQEWNCDSNYLWLEIFGDNYNRDNIIGFGIKNEKGTFYINKINAINCSNFQHFLQNKKLQKITWDLKKVIIAGLRLKLIINNIIFDHMLAAYLLYANEKILPENIAVMLNVNVKDNLSADDFYGKGIKKNIPNDEKEIAIFLEKKLNFLTDSHLILIKKLKDTNNWNLYQEIELPAAFVLVNMECNGVNIDQKKLKLLTNKTLLKIQDLELQIKKESNSNLNPNSPKQISEYLFKELKLPNYKKGSTAFAVLISLKNQHPIIDILLEYRKLQKLYSTYLLGLQKYIFDDGKIHSIYNQVQTSTGRLSSLDPNMQNISIRDKEQREVRKIFIPSKPHTKILSCDYSQIELRILAHISEDENLIKAFQQKHDIHRETASKILNIPLAEVTNEQRQNAKAINFGIVYGISSFGLSQQIGIKVEDAKIFINKYFSVFPKIKSYINNIIDFCEKNGYVQTIFNRRREVMEITNKNKVIQNFGKRIAMNMPIQGSAADILKLAMNKIYEEIKKQNIDAILIAQIHDELIFEVEDNKVNDVITKITKIMSNVTKLKVPLLINTSIGDNWFELK
ncbi:DNA polymerase I [Spiroplasma endosymbiont of Lariophagus distinguendus]|uniref:DNA polymerase I n=1 Tax=Spiroplasma endosymbiont of Lariophagus distinguendus TaxID=2935082 RepID=UPI002079A8E1|nr:DNA polymerase I [Spiroplasma endosymbiont of Lariophagus distinguendus]